MRLKVLTPKVLDKRPDAVLFDLDDTLYAYAAPHEAAIKAVKSKASSMLGIEPRDFEVALTAARQDTKDRLGPVASSHSRLLYFQRMLERLGMRTQVLVTLDLEQTYWRAFLDHAELFPGVQDFLVGLRALGSRTAMVTDLTTQIQFRKIVYFGLEDSFDFVVTSEEAGADKPDESCFRLAADKLGLGPSATLWMVGEHPDADIKGAKQHLKCFTFQKVHSGVRVGRGEDKPDVAFDSFEDLMTLLRKWERGGHGPSGSRPDSEDRTRPQPAQRAAGAGGRARS